MFLLVSTLLAQFDVTFKVAFSKNNSVRLFKCMYFRLSYLALLVSA